MKERRKPLYVLCKGKEPSTFPQPRSGTQVGNSIHHQVILDRRCSPVPANKIIYPITARAGLRVNVTAHRRKQNNTTSNLDGAR